MNGDFPPDTLRAWGGAAVERLARYFETIESRPVLARTKPGELLAQFPPERPRGARAVGGDRARPRPPRRAEPDPLAAPGLHGLLRDERLGARHRRRDAGGRLQPGRHPLALVPRLERDGAGDGPLAREPRRAPGRVRRAARRHRVGGFAHRPRRRTRAGVPRRAGRRGSRGSLPPSSTARSSRTPRSTRRASSSASGSRA